MTDLQEISAVARRRAAKRAAPLVFAGALLLALASVLRPGPTPPSTVAAQPGPAAAAAGTPPAARAVRHGRIRLATGVELHVAEAGPADGVPVLLLHGYTDSWYSWSPVLERLPAGVRAVVPTQRGHGDSERPDCCYRMADFARDAAALLDALGIERAHVVGHSMGGLVAQRFALDYPGRVERLVIVGSGADARTPAIVEFNGIVHAQVTDRLDSAFVREFQESTAAAPLPPAFLAGVIRESSKLPARLWREVLDAVIAPDAVIDAARIRAPTLVVWGAHDVLFDRSTQDALVRAIPDAHLVVFPEAAHSPNWENPDRFVREVAAFLGVAGSTPPAGPDAQSGRDQR